MPKIDLAASPTNKLPLHKRTVQRTLSLYLLHTSLHKRECNKSLLLSCFLYLFSQLLRTSFPSNTAFFSSRNIYIK